MGRTRKDRSGCTDVCANWVASGGRSGGNREEDQEAVAAVVVALAWESCAEEAVGRSRPRADTPSCSRQRPTSAAWPGIAVVIAISLVGCSPSCRLRLLSRAWSQRSAVSRSLSGPGKKLPPKEQVTSLTMSNQDIASICKFSSVFDECHVRLDQTRTAPKPARYAQTRTSA
jgi:hypothetical protein